jgi:acyl transferase domain-containing protein/acyl carrier protein/NAD(P)-dependent dehydrogenase (short-subunit alcohol dehydrogenase family)
MSETARTAVAIVGMGAIMPDAPDARTFWDNIKNGRYSVTEVPPHRWDANKYYDPDPKAPDMTYSKIGGWVREYDWNPLAWKLPIPPKVSDVMDRTQKWAVMATREALADYGYPGRPLDSERTAVILGNAMGGDQHLFTAARALFPEVASAMGDAPSFSRLPADVRAAIIAETRAGVQSRLPDINEDTMPGELANIVAGRVSSLFNFRGPNYTADAACASAMAATSAAIEGLEKGDFDVVITGGVDANMAPSIFVKFCKIGALSATGSRPYAEGADGFVMGEGAALFIMKRLQDAERDGDTIYAVVRGVGGSSDGKGKGITAPNPVGQKLAVRRGWDNAGLVPQPGDLIEGHGTSTAVGDVAELESLSEAFKDYRLPAKSLAVGSVKSNIGHLKGAAGSAGVLKAAYALYEKVLPPSINFHKPNPGIDWETSPFAVNTELREWEPNAAGVRRAAVSAFGFGGTNFHTVLEEYIPGRIKHGEKVSVALGETFPSGAAGTTAAAPPGAKKPLRGALVVGDVSEEAVKRRLEAVKRDADAGIAPPVKAPAEADLRAPVRLAIDYGDAAELSEKAAQALTALEENQPGRWKALRAKGIHIGRGPASKVAFLFTGQGSQYVNMLRGLMDVEPIIVDAYAEADRVMEPHLDKKLSEYIFVDDSDEEVVAAASDALKQTEITQPAVLATETALARMLASYGIKPDMVMGHSLGEYGALVAGGALPFADGLYAVSARGGAMTRASKGDNGQMAAAWGPIDDIQKILDTVDGYVVVANINSRKEAVIGGASDAVQEAMAKIKASGHTVTQLQVSHAFHTAIVAEAADSLAGILKKANLQPPAIPIVANITGEFYPMGPGVEDEMVEILSKQVASPVQFVKGLDTLYDAGARVFIELGPKRALYGFALDVVGDREDVICLFTNHPRIGDIPSFNQALCGLYAAGLGVGEAAVETDVPATRPTPVAMDTEQPAAVSAPARPSARARVPGAADDDKYVRLGKMFTEFLDKALDTYADVAPAAPTGTGGVVITGASLGLPGVERVFDDANIERILGGEVFIKAISEQARRAMADKHITRLVKSKDGEASFETIDDTDDVIKLAARGDTIDLVRDFGFPRDRLPALDVVTRLAIAAGVDAMRDAGIPLVMRYKTTTKGTKLPDRWMLPENMRDDTGVVFGSAFPGYDAFASEMTLFHEDRTRRERLRDLEELRDRLAGSNGGDADTLAEIDKRIATLQAEIEEHPFQFDRRFLFRILAMGHSQFAEYIGARGPNTMVNGACASGGQAIAIARDWIAAGRCRRAIIISADNVTSDNLMEWIGSGFLASGAAATDAKVEDAAIPFDRRRHGLIIGMGGASLVLESPQSAAQRGIQPICDVLATVASNSAFHGTRLDVDHICQIMEHVVADAERTWGVDRHQIAAETVFVSHETYTPARGGSASAEVNALRRVFGASTDKIVIANTKGYTGHPMGVGIEEAVAVKILETGIVPPVPNFKEVDPELGTLNLSKGGHYPVRYALRLAAGFGSQVGMALMRWIPTPDGQRRAPNELGFGYRVIDEQAWRNWLREATGYGDPEIEISDRTLRVKDEGPAAAVVAKAAEPVKASAEPVAPKPTAPAAAAAVDPVQEKVLAIIADKSGYPPDMLEMDLDLEADLGIDTVKQAEMFAAIREAYDIPRDDNLKLRDFPTLAHAVQFVYERRPDMKSEAAGAAPAPAPDAASTPAAAPIAPSSIEDEVKSKVLQIVSEQTGYPVDMLDLDLDLEADLGIDTVKQAETFAAIREAYDIPRDDNLKLRDFPTLAHTIQFVFDRRPDLKAEAAATVPAPAVVSAPPDEQPRDVAGGVADEVERKVLEVVSEQTGYPVDMLDLDLDLEADLGIDTVKQAEMFAAIREAYDIPRDDNLKLRDFPTLAHTIQFVFDKRPDLKAEATEAAPAPPADAPRTEAPQAEAPAPGAGARDDAVKQKVLEVISEQTGYPVDMLDLDLDLEADLGIDTVKQAEMFAAIREAYGIPRDENLKLRDFPTLAHTIQFVYDRRPDLAVGPSDGADATAGERPAAAATTADGGEDADVPRRVPVAHLRPGLELCKKTGVALGKDCRVIVVPDKGGVGKALISRLQKLGTTVLVVDDAPGAEELTARIEKWMGDGAIHGLYWLPALDVEAPLSETEYDQWKEATRVRVKLLYAAARALYEQLEGPGTFLVSATRLGGRHGYDEAGALAPLGGAVAGFTKAFKREKPQSLVKVVDFEASRKTATLADRLIEETLRDPGIVEVGYADGHRWTVGIEDRPLSMGNAGISLDGDTVFVITGAAGSITSAITADLAAASGGTFHLLDIAPAPRRDDETLRQFAADKEGLKRELFERMKATGERVTPKMVDAELAAIERKHAALSAMEAVEAAGGTAHYYSVNLLDHTAVVDVIKRVEDRSGRVDVLVHAAGLEISRRLPDKAAEEFDLVFDVKADGWFNVLSGLDRTPPAATVVFSSIAGRFGNAGQTDYSAANDLLCKGVSNFRTSRPQATGIAIDWTAWGGIGMASRGSIPTIMKQAGIDMLDPAVGIPIVRRELTGGGPGEVIVAGSLGIMSGEFDEAGGLDIDAVGELREANASRGIMSERLLGMGLHGGLTVETTLDPKQQPFLYDHQIGDTPVLPGVMGIEALVEAAKLVFPDRYLAAIEDVTFESPFKFYRSEPRAVAVHAHFKKEGDDIVADCRLEGSRTLHGREEPEVTTHFTARVRLAETPPQAEKRDKVAAPKNVKKVDAHDIYRLYFHGPAYQVVNTSWRAGDKVVGVFNDSLPANHRPEDRPTIADPRLIELCFQTAGLYELVGKSRMGLPYQIGRVEFFQSPGGAKGHLQAAVTAAGDDRFDAQVVDDDGQVFLRLHGYRTMELPDPVAEDLLRPLRDVMD